MSDEFDQPSPPPGSSWSGPLAGPAGRNVANLAGLQHTQLPLQLVLLIKVTLLYPLNYILSGPNIQ